MVNVKELLASWKQDLAQAGGLLGTDGETLNEREFTSLAGQIEALERAIRIDEAWAREEAEHNNHLGRF